MKSIIALQEEKAAIKQLATQAGIDAEQALIEKKVLFTRKEMTARAGIVKLLEPSDSKMDGIRNIDNAKLVGGEAFVCTGISFAVAVGKTAVPDGAMASLPFSRSFLKGAPNGFYNNEFSLKIGSKEKLNLVLRHACPALDSDDPTINNYCEVTPFVIKENQTILPELNCVTPNGSSDAPIFLEVALIGYKISRN